MVFYRLSRILTESNRNHRLGPGEQTDTIWFGKNERKLPIFCDDINLPFCLILIYLLHFTIFWGTIRKLSTFHDDINLSFCLIFTYLLHFTMFGSHMSYVGLSCFLWECEICRRGGGGGWYRSQVTSTAESAGIGPSRCYDYEDTCEVAMTLTFGIVVVFYLIGASCRSQGVRRNVDGASQTTNGAPEQPPHEAGGEKHVESSSAIPLDEEPGKKYTILLLHSHTVQIMI